MRTAFLGAYGYGNLGDELCLMEAMRAFPSEDAHAFSVAPEWTMRCAPGLAGCFRDGGAMLALKPRRVVFGGGMFGTPDAFRAWLPHLAAAEAAGAEIHFHNLGVSWLAKDLRWLDETARGVFLRAASYTVRDVLSVEYAAMAGIGRLPRISVFPEADIPADPELADALLPHGTKLLGVSIIPMPLMRAALAHEAARVRALVADFADHAVLPVVSTVHLDTPDEDDVAGCRAFLQNFLPGAQVVAPILLDRDFWRAEMTPARLKGLIARCDTLLTQRKHNAIHGIGAGVRVIGLHPLIDNSLRRTFVTLAHRLPPGSRCVGLETPA
jgi:polysaccharide pyruvyl transferase WcaK-like protein